VKRNAFYIFENKTSIRFVTGQISLVA